MRPSLKQIYNDPFKIIEALERAGLENAHAKVMGIMVDICEYWSVERHLKRVLRNRTEAEQQERVPYNPKCGRNPGEATDKRLFMMSIKRSKDYNQSVMGMRFYLKKHKKRLETKIQKWPELDLDPTTLRKRADIKVVGKILNKQKRRRKPRMLFWC